MLTVIYKLRSSHRWVIGFHGQKIGVDCGGASLDWTSSFGEFAEVSVRKGEGNMHAVDNAVDDSLAENYIIF